MLPVAPRTPASPIERIKVNDGRWIDKKNDAEAKEEVTEEEDFVILSNIEVEEILREIYKEEKSNEKK